MKKVLFISMGEIFGGIEKQELDIANNIKNYDIEFLTPIKLFNTKKEHTLNISRNKYINRIKYNYKLYKFLKNNKYDIIHINSSVFLFSFQVALISKITKHKIIVVESHSIPYISKIKRLLIKILLPIYKRLINKSLSCSIEAEKSLFLNNTEILNNGIDINNYKFNEKIRNEYRKNLNIEDKKVYGTIGRIDKNKNYNFLIDLFNNIKDKNSILLIIGTGPDKEQIENKIKELKLDKKVLLLGQRQDIKELLSCMDIFIFPSLKEGFGLSIIESLTSGLPTIINSNIKINIKSNNLYRIDNYDISTWKETINNIKINKRENSYKEVINSGYDIKDTCKSLEKIYNDMIK